MSHPLHLNLTVHTKTKEEEEEEEKSGKAGLWAESMIIPFRGSERSVVECSCH